MLAESLAQFHVQSFRQYMTEDATAPLASGGAASDIPWDGNINAITTEHGTDAASLGAALAANLRYRNAGLTRRQIQNAMRRNHRDTGGEFYANGLMAGRNPTQRIARRDVTRNRPFWRPGKQGTHWGWDMEPYEGIDFEMKYGGIDGNFQQMNRAFQGVRHRQNSDIS